MWVWKCSVETVEEAVELGRWKHFTDLNSHFLLGFQATCIITPMLSLPTFISCMGAAQGNSLHLMHVQWFSSLSKDYPLLCIILLLPLHEFYSTFQCPYRAQSIKWSIYIFGDPANYCPGIILCVSFQQPLHFFAQSYAWNMCQLAPYWCNNAFC